MFASISLLLLSLTSLALSDSPAKPTQFGLVSPSNAMLFLNGFHFINGHPHQHIEANHNCVIMSDTFIQCAVYVPNTQPARLAGIEYIVTGSAFRKLPLEERQLWHSHQFEVSSGYLIEPGLPQSVDDAVMNILADSYGKTFNVWPYHSRHLDVPHGIPELVAGFTDPGQLGQEVVEARDEFWGVNSSALERHREGAVEIPPVIKGADAFKEGIILTLELRNQTAEEYYGAKQA